MLWSSVMHSACELDVHDGCWLQLEVDLDKRTDREACCVVCYRLGRRTGARVRSEGVDDAEMVKVVNRLMVLGWSSLIREAGRPHVQAATADL
jgi:hypothetical protein